MARIIIDTNVVLSHVIDREPRQQSRAAGLFESAVRGEHRLVVHQAVVAEAVYVLTRVYDVSVEETAAVIRDLLDAPGVIPISDVPWTSLFALWPDHVEDFGDACLAATAKAGRYDSVATFDAGFARQLRLLDLSTYWS